MAKKTTDVAEVNTRTSALLDFTPEDSSAAQSLGIVMGGSLEDRISRAIFSFNTAARLSVEAGYLLLSVKAEVGHGEFEKGMEGLGFTPRRAQELMRMAKFATALPEDRRAEMLTLPKSKLLALASADASVVQDMLDDGDDVDLDSLTVRELRQRIKELQASNTNAAVERDAALAERDGLAKKLKKRVRDAEDHEGTPIVVADIRAELAALIKKGELSVDSMHPVLVELVGFSGHEAIGEWVRPSVRLALSGLVALRLQIDGVIKSCINAVGDKVDFLLSQPEGLAFLDEGEIAAVAEEWPRLVATHQHEAALREHERKQAKPRGKGRPEVAPKAPKA